MNKMICHISETEENAFDELLSIGVVITERLKSIHPSIFFDLQSLQIVCKYSEIISISKNVI